VQHRVPVKMASEQLPSEQQVTATSPSSAPAAQDAATSSLPGTAPRERFGEDSSVLKLKGLPYTASEQQIYEFFQGFTVTSVAFVYEPDGRPSGLVGSASGVCCCSTDIRTGC
jgi:hypothetical protein